jgi:SLT domain proteins
VNELAARITLDSNGYISGMKQVISETDNATNTIKKFNEGILQIARLKANAQVGLNITEAERNMAKVNSSLNEFKKNISMTILAKDEVSESIHKIKSNVTDLVKSNYRLEISVLDKTKSIFDGITNRIFSLKTLAAGIVLGGTGKMAYDWTIGNAISNEDYLATLQTVLHDKNKGSEALKWSYNAAASTPFDSQQVVAGVTQLATSGLDYTKYLNPLGDAAAAMNKPLEQAIFAMGKLKSGQYGLAVDMFRDFGVTNQDWTKAGATFSKSGEMQMNDPQKAVDMVTKIINEKYGGLMATKSNTAGGLLSNIGDSISGMGRGLAGIDANGAIMKGGLFDNFKQQLQVIMPLLNKVQSSNAFKELQKDIGNLATAGGQKLTTFLKSFDDPKKITQYKNEFKQFMNDVKAGVNTAQTFAKAAGAIATTLKPLVSIVAAHPNLFASMFVGFEAIKGTSVAISVLKNIGGELKYLPTALGLFKLSAIDAIKNALSIFKTFSAFMLTNPIGLAITGITLAVVGLYEAWQHDWGGIREFTYGVIDGIKKKWEELKQILAHPIDAIIHTKTDDSAKTGLGVSSKVSVPGKNALGTNYWSGGLSWVGEVGPELIELPKGAKVHSNRESMEMLNPRTNSMAAQFAKSGEDIPISLAKGIKKTSPSLIDAMATTTESIIKTFGNGITDNGKYPIKYTNELTKNVTGIFAILGQQSNPLGQSVSQGLGQGMQDSSSNVTDIAKTLTDKVIETFRTGFDIHSPSRIMHEIGSHVMQGFVNGLGSKDLKGFADKQIGTITSAFGAMVNVPGGVSEWLTQALMSTGTPLSWLPGLQKLVMAESGGDPNNWNSQGVGGEHATGLLQTLPSTFKEFMQKGMNNILNPVDNAASAINYIKSRYGDVYNTPLFKGGSYVGYADGTNYATPGYHWVGEKGPELMKMHGGEEIKNNKDSMKLTDGKPFIINMYGTVIREDADIDKIATALAKKLTLAEANMI